MPTAACPNPVNCADADSPVANLSSEGAEVFKCFAHSFSPSYAAACEFVLSLCNQMAAVGISMSEFCSPNPLPPVNPPVPVIYSSTAQTCTVNCGDGTSETYVAGAGLAVGISQAGADASAYAFACSVALIMCSGTMPTLYTSAAQTCVSDCPDGSTLSYTLPAGFFSGLSQAEADAQAYAFACLIGSLLCSESPLPLPGGSGEPPTPPRAPLYGNVAQTCSVNCSNGTLYTHTVSAGTYTAASRAAANASAAALACRLANAYRVCLSDLESSACTGVLFYAALTASGLDSPTFSVSSGALPNGITLSSGGILQGVPTTLGDFAFTIRAADSTGRSVTRTYGMSIVGIDQSALSDGDVGVAYVESLTATGFTSPTWAVTAGALPPGITLNASTGALTGTPTTAGDYAFTVSVSE